ncbi:hypothetical protein [Streptomyces tauricus]
MKEAGWDITLASPKVSARLIETTLRSGKPLALVCHAPGVLRHIAFTTARARSVDEESLSVSA